MWIYILFNLCAELMFTERLFTNLEDVCFRLWFIKLNIINRRHCRINRQYFKHRWNSIYRSTTRFLPGFLHRNQTKYYRIQCFLFYKPVQVEVTSWAYKTGFWCKQYNSGRRGFICRQLFSQCSLFSLLAAGYVVQIWVENIILRD